MRPRPAFVDALAARVLLCDGAMGTLAQASGVRVEGPGAELCLFAPELVASLHRRYLDAGADVIETHTYGAIRPRLARSGLAGRTRDINRAGAEIAVAARDERAGEDRPVWVAGSVSPAARARSGPGAGPAPAERDDAVREQVGALVEGGVDLVLLETFTAGADLVAAVRAVRDVTDLPVVAQATFLDDDLGPRTAAGEDPGAVLARLAEVAGELAAVGTNCTLGPQGLLAVLRAIAASQGEAPAARALPLAAQPNAGLPHIVSDHSVQFAADADHFARYVRRYVAAGARMVGGCCGTTPEHTAAARAVLDVLDDAARADAETAPADPVRPGPPDPDRVPARPVARGTRTRAPGAVRRWLEAGAGRRPFLVGAEVAASGTVAARVARARDAATAGADALWTARVRGRPSPATPAAVAVALRAEVDVDVAVTVTGWDTGGPVLAADLLGLHALGLRTLVCETGNPPVHADQSVRDGAWELDAVELLRLASGLNRGVDADGLDLPAATDLTLGARCTAGAPDLGAEAARTREKIDAGARFLVCRPVYELERLRTLLRLVDADVPVLMTLAPLRDFAHAEYARHEVPGLLVPDTVLDRMRRAPGSGPALARELVATADGLVDGVVVRWPGPDLPGVLAGVRGAASAR